MKTYIITGGGHFPGLGSSTAVQLLERGDAVVVNSRRFDTAWSEYENKYPQRLELVYGDISEVSVQELALAVAIEKWGRLDGLVNNASTGRAEYNGTRFTRACWHENFTVNVIAAYEFSDLCVPHLRPTKGSIVNVSSRAALQPGCGNNMAYALSKSALNHLTKNQALLYAPEVTVNAICPSWTNSQRLRDILGDRFDSMAESWRQKVLIQELIDPDQAARSVLHLLDSHQINGHILSIDGGAVIQPAL